MSTHAKLKKKCEKIAKNEEKKGKKIKEIKCNINLIPYNDVTNTGYTKPSNNEIMKFKYLLEHSGKKVTVRLERGADIDAACGQLSGKVNNK